MVWIAKGAVMPSFSSASTVSGRAPSAAKPFGAASSPADAIPVSAGASGGVSVVSFCAFSV
jgi:hypothetical protein